MSEIPRIEKVEKYRTRDQKEHYSIEAAERWAICLERAEIATERVTGGDCLGDILPETMQMECPPELTDITKETGVVISHWQCSRDPVYHLAHINPNGTMHFHGIPKGQCRTWYGSDVTIADLVRHMAETERESNLT